MNKLKIIAIIFVLVSVTFLTILANSNQQILHKQVIFTDAEYKFVEEKQPIKELKATDIIVTPKETTVKNTVAKKLVTQTPQITKKNVVKQQPVKISNTSTTTNKQKVKTTTPAKPKQQQIKTTNTVVNKQTKVAPKTQQENTNKQKVEIKQQAPTVTKKVEQQVVPQQKKTLTEKEETIVWNKWRSDLQNKIMRDTKIGAPQGTVFRFSFTVDKFGNLSNIKVWSDNSVYTDLAVRVIKPIITSYQRTSILKFPEGTKRTIVNASGGFAISTHTEYSTPENYNDVEKVKTKQYK